MTIHPTMLTLIDTVSETVKQSLINFAQNPLESNAGTLSSHSSHLVSEVSTALQANLNESGRAVRAARGEAVTLLMAELDKSLQVIDSVDGIAANPELDDAEKVSQRADGGRPQRRGRKAPRFLRNSISQNPQHCG